MKLEFSVYRYSPDVDGALRMQDYTLETEKGRDMMLLDALIQLKEKDPSLSLRRSCREGARNSDGLNMSGKNGLARIAPISALNQPGKKIAIHPLSGLPVIRDLVVDVGQLYVQYEKIKPHLLNSGKNPPTREYLQMSEQHEKLDGLYECILCACCSTPCPSLQWSPGKFIGPAGLLIAYRFLIDGRDAGTDGRLEGLSDAFSVFRCHNIMNYVSVYLKGLNSTHAIGHIKSMLLKRSV